jgi:hypothetical protein
MTRLPGPVSDPLVLLLLLAAGLVLGGCRSVESDRDYVARIGDATLTEAEVEKALQVVPQGMDPETARAQFVEQWITGQLLAREALRRGLRDQEDVRRQLEDNERNVLASALLSALYDEDSASFSRSEMEAYLDQNRDRMRLREPYVRVRFIDAATADEGDRARAELVDLYRDSLEPAARDSAFAATVRRFAIDTTAALSLASSFVAQSRLTRQAGGGPWSVIGQLSDRETSPVLATQDSTFIVIQLVERAPAGAEPRLDWVADEIRRRLAIRNRQQVVAREVQRLRTEAEARGELRLSTPREIQ